MTEYKGLRCEQCGNEDPTKFEFASHMTVRFKIEVQPSGKLLVTNRFRIADLYAPEWTAYVCLVCEKREGVSIRHNICDDEPEFPRNKIDVTYTPIDTEKFHRG